MSSGTLTTSWDDGDEEDFRIAELLAKYRLKGTFYPCPRTPAPRPLSNAQLRDLGRTQEIGAHTLSHLELTRVGASAVRDEIGGSKKHLEDVLGRPIDMFCFPRGKYSRALGRIALEEGFKAARTTDAFRTQNALDGPLLHVTLQAYPHTNWTHWIHALRHGNWSGLGVYRRVPKDKRSWVELAKLMLTEVADRGGVWHLWGHSWECKALDLWDSLEEIFRFASELKTVFPRTNGETVHFLHDQRLAPRVS